MAHKATDQLEEKNPAAVALGLLGELKGGKARAASLPPLTPPYGNSQNSQFN